MKKIILLLLLCAIASQTYAQKRDTVVLSVYNKNQRFMLYPMPFGKDKPDIDFTAAMHLVLDTVHVLKTDTKKDSTGKFPKRWVTERVCGKMPKDSLKGKVALLYRNAGCDISTQVLNAQKLGAIAVIVIHTTDNKDSVILPKRSNLFPYADSSKVKIPCFTVRKGIGTKLTAMLPSLVGIKRPKANVGNIQTFAIPNLADEQAKRDSIYKAEQEKYAAAHAFTGLGWAISPNPANDEVALQYNFAQKATLNITFFNEAGQVITTYELPDTQTGKLQVDVSAWHSGAYNVSLRSGSLKEIKHLMILH